MPRWGIACRAEGSKIPTTICDQQGDAIAAGREIACNHHSELRIQGRDALTQPLSHPMGEGGNEAWSYGNDPFPPRG